MADDNKPTPRKEVSRYGWAVATTWGQTLRGVTGPDALAKAVGGITGGAIGDSIADLPGLVGGTFAGVAMEESLKIWLAQSGRREESRRRRSEVELSVRRALRSSFRPDRLGEFSYGRRRKVGEKIGWHPDHSAAGAALGKPLGLPLKELAPVAQTTSLPSNLDSDIVVIGGPNATPLTMVAWEFTGSDTLQLGRRSDPTLPLRWYGLSDANESSIKADTRIGWEMEGVGPVATVNWPLVDAKNGGKLMRLQPSPTGIEVQGQTAYLPDENWLLVTRLPNFLHSKFPLESGSLDPSYWPSLLVIEAAHGVGTRAAELLVDQNALPVLEELTVAVKGVEHFQALFIVSDLDLARKLEWTWKGPKRRRFHRFNTIGLEDVEPLDLGRDLFLKAHEQAAITLQNLPAWARD